MTIFGIKLSPETVVSMVGGAILGNVIGAVISALIGWCFAKGSKRDLETETNELKAHSERLRMGIRTLARALEVQGIARVVWDKNGDPENIAVTVVAPVATAVMSATPPGVSVGDPPPAGP